MKISMILLIILIPALGFAQTAAELEQMLRTQVVSTGEAARFVLGAAELLPHGLSGSAAWIQQRTRSQGLEL